MAKAFFGKPEDRASAVSIVCYPDSLPAGSPDVPFVARVPLAVETLRAQPVRYMWIDHNQDLEEDGTPKKEHCHVALWFGRPVVVGPLAEAFGIQVTQIPKYKGKLDYFKTALYFLHWDNDSLEAGKHVYDLSELCWGGDWLRNGKDIKSDVLRRLSAVEQGYDLGVVDMREIRDLLREWLLSVQDPMTCTVFDFEDFVEDNIPPSQLNHSRMLWVDRSSAIREKIALQRSHLFDEAKAKAEREREERMKGGRS